MNRIWYGAQTPQTLTVYGQTASFNSGYWDGWVVAVTTAGVSTPENVVYQLESSHDGTTFSIIQRQDGPTGSAVEIVAAGVVTATTSTTVRYYFQRSKGAPRNIYPLDFAQYFRLKWNSTSGGTPTITVNVEQCWTDL